MRFDKDELHLSTYEAKKSGYENPIKLHIFNNAAEMERTNGELDALVEEEMLAEDSAYGRGDYASRYEAANVRSCITRAIAIYWVDQCIANEADNSLVADVEAFLNDQDPTQ